MENNGSADGALLNVSITRVTATAYLPGSRTAAYGTTYKPEVLEAVTDGKGNLTFTHAYPINSVKPSAKTNKTAEAIFEITHGAIDGDTVGIDWSKVNSISGRTFSLRQEAKANGLKWEPKRKVWRR